MREDGRWQRHRNIEADAHVEVRQRALEETARLSVLLDLHKAALANPILDADEMSSLVKDISNSYAQVRQGLHKP